MRLKSIMCLLLCLPCLAGMAIEDDSIYGEDVTIELGTTQKEVKVFLNNSVSVTNFQFDMYLPDGMTVLEQEIGTRLKTKVSFLKNEARYENGDDHSVQSQQNEGAIRVICTSTSNKSILDEDINQNDIRGTEPVLTFILQLDEDMKEGAYDIELKNVKLTHYDGTTTKIDAPNSTFTVTVKAEDGLLGDVNGDGKVNVSDAVDLIGYYLNNKTSELNASIADVDKNGTINVSDAVEIIDIYLNNK